MVVDLLSTFSIAHFAYFFVDFDIKEKGVAIFAHYLYQEL